MMNVISIGEIAEIHNGFAFDSNAFNVIGKGMPLIRIRDVISGTTNTFFDGPYDEEYIVKNGDLLIGMDGEFNIAPWRSGKALLNQRVCRVEPNSDLVDKQYLHYRLLPILQKIEDETPFVTVKHLSSEKLKKIEIDMPDFSEQVHIASILQKADRLRRLRRYARELSDGYLQSVFLEMFGDPETNPMGWVVKKSEEIITEIRYGTGSPPKYVEKGIPFIRATNIKDGTVQSDGMVFISEIDAKKISKCEVKSGDLIFVRSGINSGDCAIIPDKYNRAYAAYDLIIEIPYPMNFYFNFLINSPYGKSVIATLSRRAGQPHVNAEQVLSIRFPYPDIHLIRKFVDEYEQLDNIKRRQKESARQAEQLFQALLRQAFE